MEGWPMNLKNYLKEKNISIRKLSIITALPYATVYDIVNGRIKMEECQYKTLKPIAVFCNVSVDELVYQYEDFQTFRNKLHHRLVKEDELDVVASLLESKSIEHFCAHEDYLKALYLLALIDYILKKNDLPLCMEYSSLRSKKLKEPYYVGDFTNAKKDEDCIPEFVMHNIYEGELYDAV